MNFVSELEGTAPLRPVLRSMHACSPAVRWAGSYGFDWIRAWRECRNPDHMYWIATHALLFGPERRRAHEVRMTLECSVILIDEAADLMRPWYLPSVKPADLIEGSRQLVHRLDEDMWRRHKNVHPSNGAQAYSSLHNIIYSYEGFSELHHAVRVLVRYALHPYVWREMMTLTRFRRRGVPEQMCDAIRQCVSEVRVHKALEMYVKRENLVK